METNMMSFIRDGRDEEEQSLFFILPLTCKDASSCLAPAR